uniref:Uncharacterized protein n=1 Tax=Panagrolaimus superbus TaxID=310955 RepID=A0A914Y0K4_9BILA
MSRFSTLSLICFLLLWTLIYSSPQNRYQRDAATEFPQYGDLDLVLQNGYNFLEFRICCSKSNGCSTGSFQFCFEIKEQLQASDRLYGCGDGTCAYKIDFKGNHNYSFLEDKFSTFDQCFDGKITNERIFVFYSNNKEENSKGCPLAIKSGNRLKLDVRSIPHGVTVTAINAQKYSEPTSTSSPKNDTSETSTEETGMSDALKFGLIAAGLIVIFL